MQHLKKYILTIFAYFLVVLANATHNRAGEITYTHVSGYTYLFTLTTYTKESSVDADNPRLEIAWGDGTKDSVDRTLKQTLPGDIQLNKYTTLHTYSGPGKYIVGMQNPNRIENIINVNNSVNVLFYLEDTVIILNPNFVGYNSSPQLLKAPIEYGNIGVRFVHNPNAFDPDGDSLSFVLIPPLQGSGVPVGGYTAPNNINPGPNNQLTLNVYTGELVWDAPQLQGIYNIAILVNEYRNGVLIGTLIRDLQIIVEATNNRPPLINTILQKCVIAGDSVNIKITATDPDNGQIVKLEATGQPLLFTSNNATFNTTIFGNPATGIFKWNTSCDVLNRNNYSIVFKAEDNFVEPALADLKTLQIRVLAPPPNNLISNLNIANRTVTLKWDSLYSCANNPKFLNFSIWRKKGCNSIIDTCDNNLTNYGYQKIGTSNIYTFIDNTLQLGNEYSYRIVAEFGDKTNSGIIINTFAGFPSAEICVNLPLSLPLIYNVDIKTTSTTTGQIYIEWSKPNAINLDTILNNGNYVFNLYRADGINGTNYTLINTKTFSSFSAINDTSFLDTNLNTLNNSYNYKLIFYVRGNDSLGSTEKSSSVFLNIIPNFELLNLSWNFDVAWLNTQFVIYRKLPNSSTFDSLTTVTKNIFTDINLKNDSTYCYKIKAIGNYTLNGLKQPLINFSQEICAIPKDTIPPCTPILNIDNFCKNDNLSKDEFKNYLTWSYPANCDITKIEKFRIYYTPNNSTNLQLIDSIAANSFVLAYTHTLNNTLAGCYSVTAVKKSLAESEKVKICVDNCPDYKLPNTFTPNNDGQNDLFTPIKPYSLVEKIDLKIYNRWGNLVFETQNPDILWNGTDFKNDKPLSTAVYFYKCDVYFLSIDGLQKIKEPLSGYIHLFRPE